jgi:hypothetical protein
MGKVAAYIKIDGQECPSHTMKSKNYGGGLIVPLEEKQGVLTENLWPKLFSEAPRCAPLRLFIHSASGMPSVNYSKQVRHGSVPL